MALVRALDQHHLNFTFLLFQRHTMERTPLPQTGRKRPREESPESPPLSSAVPPIPTLRDTASPSVGPADPEQGPPKEENAWHVLCKTYPSINQNPRELPMDPVLRLLGAMMPRNTLQKKGKQSFSAKRGMQNIRAALVQLCGNRVPDESSCTGCWRGNGHWWGYVLTPSRKFSKELAPTATTTGAVPSAHFDEVS